nr:PREDICTED: pancreatic lipase-related protein 2-like [Struthio camelus australis]
MDKRCSRSEAKVTQRRVEYTITILARKTKERNVLQMFAVWITTLSLLDVARGRQVCYKRLGCFTDNPPWSGIPERQLAGLPSPPEAVNTNFLLYTRENIMKYQKISATNPSTIKASNFQAHRKTRFIIHGHLAGADLSWITDMCRFMFHVEDVNCILTDWRGGSSGLYTEAVNNVRIVGAELVYFVNLLEKDYSYSPSKFHLIGHSLGAHAAGEAGRRKPGIGRITGLDPAGPLFQYTPTMVRLDPSDAKFVDIIHTHAGHLFFDFAPGILQTCGHLDFYPNGGRKMPGCKELHATPATRNINDLMRGWRKEICVRVSATETVKGNIDVAFNGINGIRRKYTIDKAYETASKKVAPCLRIVLGSGTPVRLAWPFPVNLNLNLEVGLTNENKSLIHISWEYMGVWLTTVTSTNSTLQPDFPKEREIPDLEC